MKAISIDHLTGPGVESISENGRVIWTSSGQNAGIPHMVPKRTRRREVKYCEPSYRDGVWEIPVRLYSEANMGGGLREKIARKQVAKSVVLIAIGKQKEFLEHAKACLHGSGPLRVTVTRMGCRRLDEANLWRAIKPVEDVISRMLGIDDGSDRWRAAFRAEQETGVPYGVRIKIETL